MTIGSTKGENKFSSSFLIYNLFSIISKVLQPSSYENVKCTLAHTGKSLVWLMPVHSQGSLDIMAYLQRYLINTRF